jgi:hypothetical protein
MKSLLIALLACTALTAQAKEIARGTNQMGGDIVITDVRTPDCIDGFYRYYTTDINGAIGTRGCYIFAPLGAIRAVDDFGNQYTWKFNEFALSPYGERLMRAAKEVNRRKDQDAIKRSY